MKIFFQDQETEDVIFQIDDCSIIPNVGESVRLDDEWCDVIDRTFYYGKHGNSCTVWVKTQDNGWE